MMGGGVVVYSLGAQLQHSGKQDSSPSQGQMRKPVPRHTARRMLSLFPEPAATGSSPSRIQYSIWIWLIRGAGSEQKPTP